MKFILMMFVASVVAQAQVDIGAKAAMYMACDSAVELGWKIQESCEADFGRPFKTTNHSYVFRNKVLAPNCEARIIVMKDASYTQGFVLPCGAW